MTEKMHSTKYLAVVQKLIHYASLKGIHSEHCGLKNANTL